MGYWYALFVDVRVWRWGAYPRKRDCMCADLSPSLIHVFPTRTTHFRFLNFLGSWQTSHPLDTPFLLFYTKLTMQTYQNRRPHGATFVRSVCLFKGCDRMQGTKGRTKSGQKQYRRWCDYHRRRKCGQAPKGYWGGEYTSLDYRRLFPNKKCDRCGWDKASCDRHRLKNGREGGKYVKGNVISLCPNCHRLEHLAIFSKKGGKGIGYRSPQVI